MISNLLRAMLLSMSLLSGICMMIAVLTVQDWSTSTAFWVPCGMALVGMGIALFIDWLNE